MGSLFDGGSGDHYFRSELPGLPKQSWRTKLENAWIASLIVASWKHKGVFLEQVTRVGDKVEATFGPMGQVPVEKMWGNDTAYGVLRPAVAPLVPDEAEAEAIMRRLLIR